MELVLSSATGGTDLPNPHVNSLKVVVACSQQSWHGGEEQAALLAAGLRQSGHTCKILARRSSVFAERMAARGFDVQCFIGRGRSPHGLWQIRRWLRSWQPDVLHLNDPHALTSAGVAALGLSIPLRVAARRVDFPLSSSMRYQWLTDTVICVSQAVRQVCREAGLPDHQLSVIADGVEPERMSQGCRARGRQALQAGSDTKVLLTIARLVDHKGHRFMLDALSTILREQPRLIWAVAGDGSLRTALESQTRRLGLQHHVRFLGHRDDVPDLLSAADLLVVPSQTEGLCSSIVDAMLAGVPVVATTAGGIPDLLSASDHMGPPAGWLVPPRDPTGLAHTVLEALRSPEVTARYREQARQRAEQNFTAARMVEQTLQVYRQGLAARAALRLTA